MSQGEIDILLQKAISERDSHATMYKTLTDRMPIKEAAEKLYDDLNGKPDGFEDPENAWTAGSGSGSGCCIIA